MWLASVDLETSLGSARHAFLLSTPDALERRLELGYRRGWLLLGTLAVSCCALAVLAWLHAGPLLLLLVPGGGFFILDWLLWVKRPRLGEHPLESAPASMLGNYSREAIAQLVADASGRFPAGEQPAILLCENRLANAGSNNSWLFAQARRHNAIFLNSHLLHAFDQDELRAVVLHELAHFHRHMTPAHRNHGFVMLSRVPILAGLLSVIDSPAWPLHLLLVACAYFCLYRARAQAVILGEILELACDAQAAKLGGALPMVNALLKIEERSRLASSILGEVEEALARRPLLDVAIASSKFLATLPHEPISSEDALAAFKRLLRESDTGKAPDPQDLVSTRKTLQAIVRERERLRSMRHLPWRAFDVRMVDRKLDVVELDAYVERLLALPAPTAASLSSERSHPPSGERVLYLYIHFVRPERFRH